MKPWKRIEPTEVLFDSWKHIARKHFIRGDGGIAVMETDGAEGSIDVAVVALTPENTVVIAKQFRPGPEKVMNELPGGMADKGEEPESAALRELQEETGYTTNEPLEYIGTIYRNAYANQKSMYFIARDCFDTGNGQVLDKNEEVEVAILKITEVLDCAKNGNMTDVAAIYFAYDTLKLLEKT